MDNCCYPRGIALLQLAAKPAGVRAELDDIRWYLNNAGFPQRDHLTFKGIGRPEAQSTSATRRRVGSVVDALTNRLREAAFLMDQPDDTEFKLLRHSSFLLPKKVRNIPCHRCGDGVNGISA